MSAGRYIHASAIHIGGRGILIEGPSGAGKSTLAAMLIEAGTARGLFCALIGDDRVALRAHGGRLIVSSHPAIAGRLEYRGLAILPMPSLPTSIAWGLVSIGDKAPRLPDETETLIAREGVQLRHLRLDAAQDAALRLHLALAWLRA